MLSDYIPVYWPGTNTWSFPSCELEKYEDYVAEPQDIVLFQGHVVRGIPLVHFGTWGAMFADVGATLKAIVDDPDGACAQMYSSKKVAAETAEFFKELKRRYPEIASMAPFDVRRRRGASKALKVPAQCVVKYVPEEDGP